MNALADSADRRRALTVLDQTLLVEAAANLRSLETRRFSTASRTKVMCNTGRR
jgi:hypothetical protein